MSLLLLSILNVFGIHINISYVYLYTMTISTGKHLICDLCNIQNMDRLESLESIQCLLDSLCERHDFTILGKMHHVFEPQGLSVIYMLSESHISIHTFPEKQYLALDIYTCREYRDNSVYQSIYNALVTWFDCDRESVPMILDRGKSAVESAAVLSVSEAVLSVSGEKNVVRESAAVNVATVSAATVNVVRESEDSVCVQYS